MGNNSTIVTVGNIYKVETLKSLSSNILPNSLVLENTEAFPGYHGENVPGKSGPLHIFFITRKKYSPEKILRVTKNIKKYFKYTFDATFAEVCFLNQAHSSIRIKKLETFNIISDLQNCYIDEGIKFKQAKKVKTSSIIKIFKQFELEEVNEGIFQDRNDPFLSYIIIPEKLKWKQFELITNSIKNNIDNNNFDAAPGIFFMKGITDIVRIYANKPNPGKLKLLKEKYKEAIHELHQ